MLCFSVIFVFNRFFSLKNGADDAVHRGFFLFVFFWGVGVGVGGVSAAFCKDGEGVVSSQLYYYHSSGNKMRGIQPKLEICIYLFEPPPLPFR